MIRIFASLILFSVIAGAEASAAQTVDAVGQQGVEAMFRAEEPYIAKGRATYPKARARYLAGLPPGDKFLVRKRLTEPGTHKSEGVLVDVDAIKADKIFGRIVSVDLPSFRRGQRISFPESELLDWAILHPDDTVEGNVVGKFLEKAQSAYTNDLALSSAEIAKIRRICRRFIGYPFQDASRWMELAPYIQNESDLLQPTTSCGGQYCSGGLRLRDDTQFLYTYLHTNKPDNGDITADLGHEGNNRFVGIELIKHGKTICSEGHVDQKTADRYLSHRDSPKSKTGNKSRPRTLAIYVHPNDFSPND